MTVSIGRMNINYYLSTTAKQDGKITPVKDLTSYYLQTGAPAGRWFGAGLKGLSLTEGDTVQRNHARALFDKLVDPLTGKPLGRRPIASRQAPQGATTPKGAPAKSKREAVAGFDLTFSVPKSVSVLWALADPATQGRLYAAHQAAIAQTIAWLEAEVIQARSGHGGVAHVDVEGLIGTSFDHWDSRAGDPQLHTHAVIANRVQRVADGQWVTLDSYTLHRHVVAASELYNGLLFDEVQRRTGAVAEQRGGELSFSFTDTSVTEDPTHIAPTPLDSSTAESRYSVELAGIPEELIAKFSTRSRAVETETERLIAEYVQMHNCRPSQADLLNIRRQATLATRTAKPAEAKPLSIQMFDWKQQARDAGFNVSQIIADALAGDTTLIEASTLPAPVIERIASYVLHEVSTKRPTFTRANIHAATSRLLMTVRCHTSAARLELTDRITNDVITKAVQLSPERMGTPAEASSHLVRNGHSIFDTPESWLYSTQHQLNLEESLQNAATVDAGPHLEATDELTRLLTTLEVGQGHTLAADQAKAAEEVLTSHKRITAIIGPAGTGKTTTMRAIHTAWSKTHGAGSVVGLAPSAVAASVLAEEVAMATENVAKWLYESTGPGAAHRAEQFHTTEQRLNTLTQRQQQEPNNKTLQRNITQLHAQLTKLLADQAKFTLKENQLLIIDEASMASTNDLVALNTQAEAVGAKILLVGDPAQLEAVEAGGFLGWMERAQKSSHLNSVWRFKNDWEAEASLRLRKGDHKIIDTYRKQGRITDCDPGEANEYAYKDWLQATTGPNNVQTILIGPDNESVLDLNTRAQQDLISLGHVTPGEHTATLRSNQAHPGDILLARKNDRHLTDEDGVFIKNGSRITINTVNPDGSIHGTRTDTGKHITLPASYLKNSTELGYAVTAHRSQGVTVDRAFCSVKEGLGRELLYVGMTRGKQQNQLYVETPDTAEDHSPDNWGIYKIERTTTHNGVIAGIMANSTAVLLAQEERNAAHGAANDLARYVSEYEHLDNSIRNRELTEWINRATNTPGLLRDLQNSPNWSALVNAWVPGSEPLFPEEITVEKLKQAVDDHHTEHTATFEGLIRKAHPITPEEQRICELLEHKISARLTFVTRNLLEDPEPWIETLPTGTISPTPTNGLLRAVVLWRELSDQQEELEAYGEPPRTERRLNRYFQRLKYGYLRPVPDGLPDLTDEATIEQLLAEEPHPLVREETAKLLEQLDQGDQGLDQELVDLFAEEQFIPDYEDDPFGVDDYDILDEFSTNQYSAEAAPASSAAGASVLDVHQGR